MMMRPGDILGRIFFILSQKSIIGIYPRSTRRTRIFLGSCFARNLGGNLFKMLLRKKYCGFAVYLQTKSLTKIIDQNALEFLAFGENFIMDRLTARNLN